MREFRILLTPREDGSVAITADLEATHWEHQADASAVQAVRKRAAKLNELFDSGHRPLDDPVDLANLGRALCDTFLAPFAETLTALPAMGPTRLLFSSTDADCLNLPWELLPASEGKFLVADARCAIRRTTHRHLLAGNAQPRALPLRILFVACAPIDQAGLDHEKEEEAILSIAHRRRPVEFG
jgi:hypothetical protein